MSVDELRNNYRHSKDPIEARGWHFLWKVASGWTVKNSALALGISVSYGWNILKSYNKFRISGAKNEKKKIQEHPRGSKLLLNEQ